ncbi:phage tail sheath subtilisin-like domain-containing protein [Desulfobaculum bizertense]|uniref:phage tail sheath C-terminal domain-containing protein n=1 Tax=Desulfobaculum bizertense TaxID=376490 RepID=UPI001F337A97|nr:phage tail sheath C-terminal domain-containing protein [Desulfobaculum bizertense]UIJ38733.1 phage tail sheath subtilisin-like domain-containing protein [Desulfobaculum bizertense]
MPEQFLHGVEVVELDSGPRPIQTVKSSVIGLVGTAPDADASAFPVNTPVLIAGNRTEAAKLDTTGNGEGTLPAAIDGIFDQTGAAVVVIRVEEGDTDAATQTNMVGGTDATTGQYTGVHALLGAKSALGLSPRILIAPGHTHQRASDPDSGNGGKLKNPVVAELEGIADKLRAVVIVDGPNTTDAEAQAAISDFGTARIYMVDPWVKVFRGGAYADEAPASRVAGLIARIDNDKGFWWSPSNQQIYGIAGTSRGVDFALGSSNCRANLLNEKNIATIINEEGYRLWGNRTACSDKKWAFLSVRRTADMINESILRAHLWAVDRNISKNYMEAVVESVNAYLRHLTAIGAVLGGSCWADPELNTKDQIAKGNVFFDFDFTPPAPAEHVTFRSHLVNDYLEEVLK